MKMKKKKLCCFCWTQNEECAWKLGRMGQ